MKKRNDNEGYPKSFAKRLTWRIMLTLLLVMGFTSTLIFGAAWVTIYTQSEVLGEQMVKEKKSDVQHILSNIYVASHNTVPEIEDHLNRPDKLFGIMERIVRLNPLIRSCGVSFAENYYPKRGRLFCPYAIQTDSTTILQLNLNKPTDDYLKEQWFLEGMKAEHGYWSEPYITSDGTPVVSYLAPIRDTSGTTVAVFGADLSLEAMEHETILSKNYRKGPKRMPKGRRNGRHEGETAGDESYDYDIYYFIVDSTGRYIMHPDHERVVNKNMFTYARQERDTLATFLTRELTTRKHDSLWSDDDDNQLTLEGTDVHAYYSPIENTSWSICFVLPHFYVNLFAYLLGGLLLLLIGIGLLVVFFAGRRSIKRAVRPLNQLAASADEVAKGNFDTKLPQLKYKDEICQLRDSFEQMQLSLTQYVDELKETTAQRAAFEKELKVAHDIQMSMLPKTFPPYPERDDIDIYGQLKPARAVGGDLFDFYIRDEKLFFCIGDVSGKGVPASLFMAVTRSLFRNASTHESSPRFIVEAMNNSTCEGNEQDMFVTLFVGVLDLTTGYLQYCNAGHNEPLIIGHEVSLLPCEPNLPIGIMPDMVYEQQDTTIAPNTTIFLFTDGLNEAEDIQQKQFGDERVMQYARQQVAEKRQQPKPLIESMTQAVHDFVGGAEQSDDLTMLAIEYKPTR